MCCESHVLEEYPQSMHMSRHDICVNCVAKYLRIKILMQGIVIIACPAEQCTAVLGYNEIGEHSDVVTFAKCTALPTLLTVDMTNFSVEKHMRKIRISGGVPIALAQPVKL